MFVRFLGQSVFLPPFLRKSMTKLSGAYTRRLRVCYGGFVSICNALRAGCFLCRHTPGDNAGAGSNPGLNHPRTGVQLDMPPAGGSRGWGALRACLEAAI